LAQEPLNVYKFSINTQSSGLKTMFTAKHLLLRNNWSSADKNTTSFSTSKYHRHAANFLSYVSAKNSKIGRHLAKLSQK